VALRRQRIDAWPTRDRILYEASRLIASRGYHGATTREIAERVGIKQPSMFNHFASKLEILKALLVFDLMVPSQQAQRVAVQDKPAGARLFRYALWDLHWYQAMPFDLRGLQEDLVHEPGLEHYELALADWSAAIDRILSHGVTSGEFRPEAAPFVPAILDTLSWEFVRSSHKESESQGSRLQVVEGAAFVLRGLLVNPQEVEALRAETQIVEQWPSVEMELT
jgi:AcrR family transcriptional regulator